MDTSLLGSLSFTGWGRVLQCPRSKSFLENTSENSRRRFLYFWLIRGRKGRERNFVDMRGVSKSWWFRVDVEVCR